MINSTTSTDRAAHPEPVSATLKAVAKPAPARTDKLSTENAAFLRTELARQPEIRADVVERARALAADPNYPSAQVLQQVGRMLLNSPDLSEDES